MGFFEEVDEQDVQRNSSLWVEKYRPSKLEEYIGNEQLKDNVSGYLENNDVPHLLFYGAAGTGKTTLAKLIINQIDCDFMIINASDENNVDTVRTKIKNFASSVGFKDLKVIVLDECDYLSAASQAILRNLMETFSHHCRFILTCNYVEKIISPIQSRCQTYEIIPPTKPMVAKQLVRILDKEQIKYSVEDLVKIVDKNYPDIRKIIGTCQQNSLRGTLKVDESTLIDSDVKVKLLELLKASGNERDRFMKIRQLVADNRLHDFTELYEYLYDKMEEYTSNHMGVVLTLSEAQYQDALVVDKEITFMAAISKILSLK